MMVKVFSGLGIPDQGVAGPGSAQPVADVSRQFLLLTSRDDPVDHDHDEADEEKGDSDPEQSRPVCISGGTGDHAGEDHEEAEEDEDDAKVEGSLRGFSLRWAFDLWDRGRGLSGATCVTRSR